MTSETVGLPPNDPQTYLTESEVPQSLWKGRGSSRAALLEADRSAAARLEDLLELQDRARVLGLHDLSEVYANRIVDELGGDAA